MSREKETYRDNLERVSAVFGDAELIPILDAAKFLGCYHRTLEAEENFPIKRVGRKKYTTKVGLAHWLS